jgi:hypothetical protein
MTIDGFARLCNSCKCVMKGNHGSNDKAITVNRCKSYLQYHIYGRGGLGQMAVWSVWHISNKAISGVAC